MASLQQEHALATFLATQFGETNRKRHLDKVSEASIRTAEVTI